MKEDIIGGIRNALEHGESLEKAVASFVSAGYSQNDVNEAAQEFSRGVTNSVQFIQTKPNAPNIQPTLKFPVPSTNSSPNISQQNATIATAPPAQAKDPKRKLAIVFIIILIVLIGGLATFLMYSDAILSLFKG
ncbi:MAG: hypothetical protein AABX66_02340 [Nanoarchaeota archaeon]